MPVIEKKPQAALSVVFVLWSNLTAKMFSAALILRLRFTETKLSSEDLSSFLKGSRHLTCSHSVHIHLLLFLFSCKTSHPLSALPHIFQSHPLLWKLNSGSRIFIKTCNNTVRGSSFQRRLSDMRKEVRIFRRQRHGHMKEKLVSGKGHPLLHQLHFPWCETIQTQPLSRRYPSLQPLCGPPGRPPPRHGTTSRAISLPQKQHHIERERERAHWLLFINKVIHK